MTYYKAKLIIKDKLHKTELFTSLEYARLWSMEESKLAVSHRMFNDTKIITEITSHKFA
jgi:hypothetical protein